MVNEARASKLLTRGCPQGSVLGPTLWSIATEQLARERWPGYADLFIYADDVAVLVSADNRRELEARVAGTTQRLAEWAFRQKLEFSIRKTKYMLMKGRLQRNPTVRLGGQNVSRVDVPGSHTR